MLKKIKKHDTIYWFTMAWDGYDGDDGGEVTESRYTLEDMKESINHYLNKYKKRGVYLECCSVETPTSYTDLTTKMRNK